MHACAASAPVSGPAPRRQGLEVADIFRVHGEALRHSQALTDDQTRVMRDILHCRTAALGGHVDVCDSCGDARVSYNSCRNRHCPKCQCLRQANWVAERTERVLPTRHFHVVFTVPQELKPLALRNRRLFFALLLDAAAQTLLELGHDPKRLGGLLGVTAVLHTWTRSLAFHPHVHCIVTGGGLAGDGTRWAAAEHRRGRYLFPVKVMAALFRGKLLAGLLAAAQAGELVASDAAELAALRDRLYRTRWVVYCKAPFGGATHVFNYLGRYTHRVGISNQRLIRMDERGVTFSTKGRTTDTLAGEEFLRRFLLHVLPKGFVKIRHFGLYAPGNVNHRLQTARRLIAPATRPKPALAPLAPPTATLVAGSSAPPPSVVDWRDQFLRLTGVDLTRCRVCGQRSITRHALPARPARSPRVLAAALDSS